MPANYKYNHISLDRLQAIKMASSQLSDLYSEFARSRVIDPSVIERMRILRLLVNRAAGNPVDSADIPLLNELLGEYGKL